jgi:hypothetical protein
MKTNNGKRVTRKQILDTLLDLVSDADAKCAIVKTLDPSRVYLARAVVDDTVRAYALIKKSPRITMAVQLEAEAFLVRAKLMSDALSSPVQ